MVALNIVAPNYNPPLGPFTDTWDDLVNGNGESLHFGRLSYSSSSETFRKSVKPSSVKTALTLLGYLKLELHVVEEEKSLLFDSLMLDIKDSSKGAKMHFNSIGKPNHMFAWFVIDFLAMSILFDTFTYHRSLGAPAPFKKVPLSKENEAMLVHNKDILIKFCIDQGISWVGKYFVNEKTGDVGTRGCVNLDQLWSTSTKFYRQLKAGIVTSFQSYKSNTGEKMEQKLWIHHFMILQLFHPSFRFPSEDDSDAFVDDNHLLFVERMTVSDIQKYNLHYDWKWLGCGGKII